MSPGLFITFEGLDGSGKTTQIKRLAAWLERHWQSRLATGAARPVGATDPAPSSSNARTELAEGGLASGTGDSKSSLVLTRQPGGTATGDRIRTLLLDSRSTALAPMTEMALMFADRAQAIAEIIAPALDAGKIVLCDRFTDSTEAYQGGGRELGSETVLELHRLVCGNLQPDLTLLLLPSLEASLHRARRRNERVSAQTGQDESRFEQEQDAFYRRVWQKYHEIAAREPGRVVCITGNLSIDEVHEQVVEAVAERLLAMGQGD